jgi:hypothetical protein
LDGQAFTDLVHAIVDYAEERWGRAAAWVVSALLLTAAFGMVVAIGLWITRLM